MLTPLCVSIFIAWDKVQRFHSIRSGKTSRVETDNVVSMLFYEVQPPIRETVRHKRTEKMKRIILLLLALLISQSLSAQKEYKELVRFHVPIGATEDVAKNIIRNHNYSISHTKDDNGVHCVYYKDNGNMSITKYFVAIGMKNGKVESVKWFLESDSYDRINSEKNAISAYLQEELKYKAKEYGGEYYYTNFNYYGQTVGVVMASQASYYNGGFVRLTFYSNKTVSNMFNEKKYNELIADARYLYREKKYDEAKKKFDEAFALFPDRKANHQQLYKESILEAKFKTLIKKAEDMSRIKKYDEAKKKYDEAFELFPERKNEYQNDYIVCGGKIENDINIFYTLIYDAGDLRKQKKYDEAKKKYDEAFEIFPDKIVSYQKEYDECVTGTETKELVNPNSQNQKQTYFDSQGEEKRQQERLQLLKQKSQEIEKQYVSFYSEFEKELSESEDILERDPAFPGGLETLSKYIADNIEYPPQAKDAKVTGTVYVSFIVEKDGSITIVECLRDIGYGCCEEAILLVKSMPRWNPGIQKGKPVRTQFNLPITFDLQ